MPICLFLQEDDKLDHHLKFRLSAPCVEIVYPRDQDVKPAGISIAVLSR